MLRPALNLDGRNSGDYFAGYRSTSCLGLAIFDPPHHIRTRSKIEPDGPSSDAAPRTVLHDVELINVIISAPLVRRLVQMIFMYPYLECCGG